jgi:alpha-galactosidase/6-phospho-beta-glucosidase family protein
MYVSVLHLLVYPSQTNHSTEARVQPKETKDKRNPANEAKRADEVKKRKKKEEEEEQEEEEEEEEEAKYQMATIRSLYGLLVYSLN